MKLVRFRHDGEARIGALASERVVDLQASFAAAMTDSGTPASVARLEAVVRIPGSLRAFLALGGLAKEAAEQAVAFAADYADSSFESTPLTASAGTTRLLAPVADPQKVICIGQNYRDHCAEQNQPLPERAIIFAKFPTAIIGPGDSIVLPRISEQVDYEAELAFVIGKRGKHVAESEAAEYGAGYMCLNDVSARDIQFGDKQWVRGKTFDTFAPTGPALVTSDEIPDPHNLNIELTLNGNRMQSSNTSNLIFGVYYLVSYLSQV